VDEFSLHENVAIIRGYQSDNIIDSYLRTNQVGVFPYLSVPGHSVFGASGAARMAMAAGLPIISSSIPHFSDLPTIKADTPEQIAEALDRLFSSEELKKKQVEKQNQFIITNSWANIAKQYIAVFES
jgi:glycosyltransferase involved in cell wall biosynthesis